MATQNRGVIWEQAFPEWELVGEDVPTHGQNVVALSPPEEQTETIEELAAAFRGSTDLALGQLYPLVPSLYPIELPGVDKETTFSQIAAQPATDVVRTASRSHIKRLHRTLALVNMSSAICGSEQWTGEPILSRVAQLILALDPDEFYTVTKAGFGAREGTSATKFLSERTDVTDVPAYLEQLRDGLYAELEQTAVAEWIEPLIARQGRLDPSDFSSSHPQLLQRLPLLNATLVEVLAFLLPGWGLANGLLCPADQIPEGTETIDRRVFGYVVAQPGITSDEIAARARMSVEVVERILRSEGEAYRLGTHTWTTTTWRRLSIRNLDSIRDFLEQERLTLADLGYDYSGLDDISADEERAVLEASPAPAEPTVEPVKVAPRTPPRPKIAAPGGPKPTAMPPRLRQPLKRTTSRQAPGQDALFPPPVPRTPKDVPPRPQIPGTKPTASPASPDAPPTPTPTPPAKPAPEQPAPTRPAPTPTRTATPPPPPATPAAPTPPATPTRPAQPTTPVPEPKPIPAAAVVKSALPLESDDIDEWNTALEKRLRGANLAADADLSEVEMERLLDVFGAFYRKARGRHTAAKVVVTKWGAAALLTMVGCASLEYENNTFWSKYWERLGTEQLSFDEQVFRQAISKLLKHFGLDPLDDIPPSGHVQRLTVHAGLPASDFPDLLEALTAYVAVVTDRESRPFDDWITDPSQEVLFSGLGHPTRVFITSGGFGAEKILTDLVEVVSQAEENPGADADWMREHMPASVPQLVALALVNAFESMDIGEQVRKKRHVARQHPKLALESDDTIRILLPPPTSYVREPWAITMDAEVRHVTPDRFAGREAISMVLDKPVRRAVVSHPSLNNPVEMRLFDADAPIIAFTTSGQHIPTSQKLPRDEITVLRPRDLEILGEQDSRPEVTVDYGEPMGWRGWVLENWDLSELDTIRVRYKDVGSVDISIGGRELPYLTVDDDSPEPLVGVTYRTLPVYAARPWITIPAARESDLRPWTVSYRRSGALDWTEQGSYRDDERYSYELFADESELLGAYEVLVTGPDATRFETEFFLAEGLQVEYDDDLRIPQAGGMTEVNASISVEDTSLVADTDTLSFDTNTSFQMLKLRNGDAMEEVKVRPPRMEFRLTPVGGTPAWSDRRMNRHPDDFIHAALVIRGVPADVGVRLQLVDDDGKVLHEEEPPASPRQQVHSMRSDAFAHPAGAAQSGELRVRLSYPEDGDWDAPLIRYSTVGSSIRIEVDEDRILVRNARTTEGLCCHVWQVDKPWKSPVSLPVEDGIAELPASLRTAGSLRIQPVVEDDWDPVPVEPFPSRNSVLVTREGTFDSPATREISEFLAGIDQYVHFDAGNKEIWSALALLDRELGAEDRKKFCQISSVVQRDPRMAAESLAEANLSYSEKLAMFVGSGLVFHDLHNYRPGSASAFEVSEPWLDVMFSIADMPGWVYEKRMHEMDRLREIAGPSLAVILETGRDPLDSIAIDRQTLALNKSTAELRAFMESMKVVPGGLIDEAARFEAFIALIDDADTLFEGSVKELGLQHVAKSFPVLNRNKRFYENILIRSDHLDGLDLFEYAWANATWLSAAMAYYARMRPAGYWHGDVPLKLCKAWSRFVRSQPRETVIDIVIADALFHHHFFRNRKQYPYRRYDEHADAVLVASFISE